VRFQYLGDNPTIDGETVFAYLALDGNGNGILDASDKAFNFTSNPNRSNVNNLKVYTPIPPSSWNTTATEYSWNGTTSPSSMPINAVISDDRKNITWAIPFSYIGAQKDAYLRFAFQTFGYGWSQYGANATTPAKWPQILLSLPQVTSFKIYQQQTIKIYIRVKFESQASGDYSFVYQANVRSVS
jgi:hypothetical protein